MISSTLYIQAKLIAIIIYNSRTGLLQINMELSLNLFLQSKGIQFYLIVEILFKTGLKIDKDLPPFIKHMIQFVGLSYLKRGKDFYKRK